MSNDSTATVTQSNGVDHSDVPGHGNSPAAWTAVTIMVVGVLIGCVAFIIGESATLLFWAGVGVIVLGLIAGWVLRVAGYGVGGSKLMGNWH